MVVFSRFKGFFFFLTGDLISGSGTGSRVGSGSVEMVMDRGSSAVGDSRHGGMFRLLQGLSIFLSPLSLDGLPVPGWWNPKLIQWEEAGLGVEDVDEGCKGGWAVLHREVLQIEGVLDWVGPSVGVLSPLESELAFLLNWGIVPGWVPFYWW